MQSRRVWLATITGPVLCAEVLALNGVAVAEPAGVAAAALGWQPTMVVIGPEGGFSDKELAAAPALVSLGPNVLRIETAALVAAVTFLT